MSLKQGLDTTGRREGERGLMPHIVRWRTPKELQRGTQWDAYELGMERAAWKIGAGKGLRSPWGMAKARPREGQ